MKTKTVSSRHGTGAIMSGRQLGHEQKRLAGHGTKAEHQHTGHIQSGTHRTNNHSMVKGRGKAPATIANPLRGALMSGAVMRGGGLGGHSPMTHPERQRVARSDAGHLGGRGRPHNVNPY